MLLFQSILLTSLSTAVHATPIATRAVHAAPVWAALLAVHAPWRRLQLAPPCARRSLRGALPCLATHATHNVVEKLPAAGSYAQPDLRLPRKNDGTRSIGGFIHLDILDAPHVRTGPEFSWSTPDSPREDLQKMRLLSPGWGLRYIWKDAPVAVGVSACSRIVMMGKQMPVVDPITSEARVEFRLP